MGSMSRAAALAAAAFVGLQTADAGFVYSSALRSVSTTAGASSDSGSTGAFGVWFDSAFSSSSGLSALANQGSDLAMNEMSFVGASQVLGGASGATSAASIADITFTVAPVDPTSGLVDIAWIIGLSEDFAGGGNASVFIRLTDVTTSTVRLLLSNDTTAAGNLTVTAGNTYRLEVSSTTSASTTGSAFGSFNANFSIVPGPASAALIGLAGLVAIRRRRS